MTDTPTTEEMAERLVEQLNALDPNQPTYQVALAQAVLRSIVAAKIAGKIEADQDLAAAREAGAEEMRERAATCADANRFSQEKGSDYLDGYSDGYDDGGADAADRIRALPTKPTEGGA